MPFQSAALDIPAPTEGKDNVEVQIIIQPVVRADGSYTASVMLQTRHYRVGTDGQPIYIGNYRVTSYADAFAQAATDPDLAAALAVIFPAIGAFVSAKNL